MIEQEKKLDINDREAIYQLVLCFYEKAIEDPVIGFFFTQVKPLDLETHVPKVVDFWEAMLFGASIIDRNKYTGNMLNAHMSIDHKARIQTGHFTRWLYLFHESIDESFKGKNADRLKQRATKMAESMSDALRVKRGESRIGIERLDEH